MVESTATKKTYAYYPGCSLKVSAKEYDISAQLVCQKLGIELQELPDWVCCGASSAHFTNHDLSLALPARELQKAGELGLPLAVTCAMCFSRFKVAAHELKDDAVRAKVGGIIGKSIGETTPVLHVLQIVDGIKGQISVTKPLQDLKIASYYGCYLTRPREIADMDSEENPLIMDDLMSVLGAEAIDWPMKTECCGASLPFTRPDIVMKLSHRLLKIARENGADCLAVACPMCHANLDMNQAKMRKEYKDGTNMPIIYFTQLMGIAMGFTPEQLHMDKHFTNPIPLLKEKGLA